MFVATMLTVHGLEYITATVYVDPPAKTVYVCEDFEISVKIKDHTSPLIHDYEFFLIYDKNQMTPKNAWDGGFLKQPLLVFGWEISVDFPIAGCNSVHCWAVTNDGGSSGSGTLATIKFHCDSAGTSGFTLFPQYTLLSDSAGTMYVPTTITGGSVTQLEAPTATVYIEPPTYTVPICVPFKINVMIEDVIDLYSFQLRMSYNNTAVVDCMGIVDGGFLLPPTTVTHKLIDDASGLIEFNLTSTVGGVSGSGILATITFHCTGAGDSYLSIDDIKLYDSTGMPINRLIGPASRVIQKAYWEPVKLIDLVELPYWYSLVDIPFVPPGSPEGYTEIKAELEAKGFIFDPAIGGSKYQVESFFDVYFEPGSDPFEGQVTSWWSANTLEDGTRACIMSAEWEDPEMGDMTMAFVTNLLPPEQIPGVDPYIIVNAMPYMYVRFYYWAPLPIARIVTWSYWWYDSHSHPNWFWGPYWWWRTYTKAYYYPYTSLPYWRPWWSWWWHWVYWRHWYWWSTYFPYDP